MEEGSPQGVIDRAPSGSTPASASTSVVERSTMPDSLTGQSLPPKDEKNVSANSSTNATLTGLSRTMTEQPDSSISSGALNTVYPVNTFSPLEQTYYYGGYDSSTGNMSEFSNYINANSLQVVPPAMYNENPSVLFQPPYGFDTQMPYGQFSPIASPMSPIMVDGQLFSPHQIPVSPPYYPPSVSPGLPHVSSALSISQNELLASGVTGQDGLSDNMLFGPGSGYFVQFGSFGGGSVPGNNNGGLYKYHGDFGSGEHFSNRSNPANSSNFLSPMTSAALYPQPIGILGQYEHNIAQVSQPQTPLHGMISAASMRRYPHGGSYRSSNDGTGSISNWEAGRLSRLTPDRGGRRERDRDSISVSADSHGISSDHNRGPRASKPKGKIATEEKNSSPAAGKNWASTSAVHLDLYNRPDFVTAYDKAKFFVIKSFSEDNVHKSIKYSIWASTPLGNRKLDAAYHEAKEVGGHCPIFLFFSVNASGQFCGVAEMVGPVDFEKDADYWQQDRWSGQFPVQWHIIKDVPNSQFRHILLENNDNKPVTHSRDSQEVKLKQGVEMLKIFKDYDADASILEDFNFYDEREKALQEKKARHRTNSINNGSVALSGASVDRLTDQFADAIKLEDNKELSNSESV